MSLVPLLGALPRRANTPLASCMTVIVLGPRLLPCTETGQLYATPLTSCHDPHTASFTSLRPTCCGHIHTCKAARCTTPSAGVGLSSSYTQTGTRAYLACSLGFWPALPRTLLAAGRHGQGRPLHLSRKAARLLRHWQLGTQHAMRWRRVHAHMPRVHRHPAEGGKHAVRHAVSWQAVGQRRLLQVLLILLVLLLQVLVQGWGEDDRAVAAC